MAQLHALILASAFGTLIPFYGCSEKQHAQKSNGDVMQVKSETTVSGFDPDGEPVIRSMSDGTLQIHFEAMPPFFAEDAGIEDQFDDFRTQLEAAAGCPVVQEDRELFIIAAPKTDTAVKIENWLSSYPKPNSG